MFRLRELAAQLARLTREWEPQRADGARVIKRLDDMRQLVRANTRMARTVERAVARSTFDVARARASRQIEKLAASPRPVIVGPWYGEIGFETVYWAPFVRWALLNHGFDLGRIALASRGGSHHLYGLEVPYVELFDLVSPHKLRRLKTGQQKQDTVRSLDRQLARDAARQLGMRRPHLLHPSMMYATLAPLWDNVISADAAMGVLDPWRARPPRLPDLPTDYVAVRFYSSRAFPDTPADRALATATIETLAAGCPVVVLQSTRRFDDHGDIPVPAAPGVRVIDFGADPATNVAVQASVMAHARLFVGTYGGASYLAAVCGVPVIAVWSEPTWRRHHLASALEVFQRTNGGRFSVVSGAELGALLGVKAPTP